MPNEQLSTLSLHATWAGPAVAAVVCVALIQSGTPSPIAMTAAITIWTASWWVFEPVPIPVASLLPIALLPLLGILTPTQVGAAYGSPLILLLLGGFILSQGMQRSGVHRRLALILLNTFGSTSRALVFGFLLAAGLLSMWISNTATALMLLPIALAALEPVTDKRITVGVLLALAYGCSIGSLGTPIGTPPNLVFIDIYQKTTGTEIGFTEFMRSGLPVVALMLPIAGLILVRGMPSIAIELPEQQGQWRSGEKRTLALFAVTAFLWITRREPFGGWSQWLGLPTANDASVALLAVVAMFLIPSGDRKGDRLLDWKTASNIPWGILLLFGSGICIAVAFKETGLSALIGDAIASSISDWPLLLTLLVVCLIVTFLTELVSNTATTTLLMPILAAAGVGADIDPRILMLPAAMSASCAFMLPVATGPNAVVFGSGRLRIVDMARKGVRLNLAGVVVITAVNYWWIN
ncbi:MAG: DASS family sodium-coupled anion symporter [Gammaproteobacteria bacterium]